MLIFAVTTCFVGITAVAGGKSETGVLRATFDTGKITGPELVTLTFVRQTWSTEMDDFASKSALCGGCHARFAGVRQQGCPIDSDDLDDGRFGALSSLFS